MPIQKQIAIENGITANITAVKEIAIGFDNDKSYITIKFFYDADALDNNQPLKQKGSEIPLTQALSSATIEAIKSDLDDYLLTQPTWSGGTKV